MTPRPQPPPAQRWPIVVSILALAVFVFAGTALLVRRREPPAPASASRFALGLQIEKKAGDLLLTWNRSSPPVQRAHRGSLTVQDGPQQKAIILDPSQLRTGSILYTPTSGDVVLRLDVFGEGNEVFSESVRVLASVPAAAASAPAPPPAPQPASPPVVTPTRQERASRSAVQPVRRLQPPPATRVPAGSPAVELPPKLDLREKRLPSVAVHATFPPAPQPAAQAPVRAQPAAPQPGASYTPPVVLRQTTPVLPGSVRALIMTPLLVRVRARVDDTGKVIDARPADPARGGLSGHAAEAVINAVRLWRFEPARENGRAVAGEVILEFRFTR